MELRSNFAFGANPVIHRTPRLALSDSTIKLGLLEDLKGTWVEKGFNAIW
jgi:hypothetical protein